MQNIDTIFTNALVLTMDEAQPRAEAVAVAGGKIVAVGSGDLSSQETYLANPRRAYRGRALVVVRTTHEPGTMTLIAQADGLEAASVAFESQSSAE